MADNKKHSISISEKLYGEISDYCSINGLKVSSYIELLIKKGFTFDKYGDKPEIFNKEKEPIVLDDEIKELKPVINMPMEIKDEEPLINAPIEIEEVYRNTEPEIKEETIVEKPKRRRLK